MTDMAHAPAPERGEVSSQAHEFAPLTALNLVPFEVRLLFSGFTHGERQ